MAITLIAHRCGPVIFPEQTIASAWNALSSGADIVEMDVQYTCDEVPVICHDLNTRRIFGIERDISDMTINQFLILRHEKDRAYPSHTLDDVLSTGIAPILLHCKFSGPHIVDIIKHPPTSMKIKRL
jgi:glycerophosphoryl diester phosphodiesterase